MQSYPSARSANVLCDDMIIQRLLATREAEIHCLCMRYHDQPLEEVIGGVHVHRFPVGHYFEFKDGALRRPGSAADRFVRIFDKVVLRANQVLTIPIYPCFYPFRTKKFVREAEKLYAQYSFDVVACEHYGYETMMAGFNLKKNHPEVRYLQFFWDALSGGTVSRYLPKRFMDSRREALEESVFETADVSVALTSHRSALSRHLYTEKALLSGRLTYLGIPNLENVQKKAREKDCGLFDNGMKNVVFAGNTYGRNVDFFANIVKASEDASIRLWFITSCDLGQLEKDVQQSDSKIVKLPYMPHDELLSVLAHADALLNLGNADVNAIPSKVTQYIGCCLPIISTYSSENDTSKTLLSSYPAALFLDETRTDYSKLADELTSFLSEAPSRIPTYSEVKEAYRASDPEAYCELFDLPLKSGVTRG